MQFEISDILHKCLSTLHVDHQFCSVSTLLTDSETSFFFYFCLHGLCVLIVFACFFVCTVQHTQHKSPYPRPDSNPQASKQASTGLCLRQRGHGIGLNMALWHYHATLVVLHSTYRSNAMNTEGLKKKHTSYTIYFQFFTAHLQC